ncbi:hypothetical protein Ahy_B03g061810 isoform A [Arachis hypogaea]|uniref:Uncharacterized protein n=1 Tax=Arachis hypogaea TaxID=3818 RepID=A0A444ZS33_ARAHY|nr:hypothetical protein Ahy_B03g061810 isoform A [Arachis hypogaea]
MHPDNQEFMCDTELCEPKSKRQLQNSSTTKYTLFSQSQIHNKLKSTQKSNQREKKWNEDEGECTWLNLRACCSPASWRERGELGDDVLGALDLLAFEGEHGAVLVEVHQSGAVVVERRVVVFNERLCQRICIHSCFLPSA